MAEDLDLDTPDAAATDSPEESGGSASIDWGIIGGIVLGFACLFVGMILEGGTIGQYLGPSAFIIVVGGTLGATLTSVGTRIVKTMPAQFKRAVAYEPLDRAEAIETLVAFAERARREGLLVLEDDLANCSDEFLRKGVQLVVDGTDPELVKEILQTEVDSLAEENERKVSAWTAMGGYSPTLGIIGTVMALVVVMGQLDDPESLGPAIALAFLATLYGVCFANLIYLPIASKLGLCSQDEVAARELMIEGILAIQSGDNPRIVEEKLVAFLDTSDKLEFLERKAVDDEFDLAA
jgi:chemotaxis protein MotA